MNFEQFLYSYLIFLFFFVFVIGIAGDDLTAVFQDSELEDLEAPTRPPEPQLSGNAILDWIESVGASGAYFVSNIAWFFGIMMIDQGAGFLGTLVFAPAGVFMIYGIMKLFLGR